MTNIIVYKRSLARQLVKQGYQVVDIQPNKKDENKTVFFFKNEKSIMEKIHDLTSNIGSWHEGE